MSDNVDPEEVEAILATALDRAPGAEVAERDFRQPRRLSAARLAEVERRLSGAVPAIDLHLGASLRGARTLELGLVREAGADGLFAECAQPLALVRFEVAAQPGWIEWQIRPALACIEQVLGSKPSGSAERKLSRVERRILAQLLEGVVRALCAALGLAPQAFRAVGEVEEIGTWRDAPDGGDPHRLAIDLAVAIGEHEGTFRVLLPGVGAEPARPERAVPRAVLLPEHLREVPLIVGARLGSVEVRLADLLALEVGDVIPLETQVGAPLRLVVEERSCATAHMGKRRGHLAVRIHDTLLGDDED